MDKLEQIRKEEKKYHEQCYDDYKLFEKGSWLYKPVKSVMNILTNFSNKQDVRVLDLGAGVGRNSIPIAEKIKDNGGKVVCVDLLESAIEKLEQYSHEYGVSDSIETVTGDIGEYDIQKNDFDYIVAVSSLEHVASVQIFEDTIRKMAEGTRPGGVNCMIVNSDIEEVEVETNEPREAMMEVNLPTDAMIDKLDNIYDGWELVKKYVEPLEFQITRDNKPVMLKTCAITYAVRK